MTSRERVLAALRCEQPDRVPYCELNVDRAIACQLLGWERPPDHAHIIEEQWYSAEECIALAECLRLDNLGYTLRAPTFTEKVPGKDGRLFYGDGHILTHGDLALVALPDPYDDALYEDIESFLRQKGDYATWFVTRVGIFSTMLSMGIEHFSICLYEDRDLVERLLDLYVDWAVAVAERACAMGFDVYVSTDDMAFKTGPYFSPAVFHEMVLPRYQRIAEKITIPWVIHTDGNVMPYLDDLLGLGICGMHPMEKGAMDIRAMKRSHGDRLCLLGNIDLNLLGLATPEEVDEEVRGLIRDVGPGGGYIVTSGNSVAAYCLPENVRAMSNAVQKYGTYPIAV